MQLEGVKWNGKRQGACWSFCTPAECHTNDTDTELPLTQQMNVIHHA